MRILVDADSCPVLNIIEKTAAEYEIELIIFSDIYHNLTAEYGQIKKLDHRSQSVDTAIYNQVKQNDIVITQDYGLAAMVLAKKCKVLNNKGQVFSENNIDYLLMRRHQHSKLRRSGHRHPTHKKRKTKDDLRFKKSLQKIVKNNLNEKK